MQSPGFPGSLIAPLMRLDLPLAKNVLTPLVKIVFIVIRLRERSSKEELENIRKIIRSLSKLGIRIEGYIKIILKKMKQ